MSIQIIDHSDNKKTYLVKNDMIKQLIETDNENLLQYLNQDDDSFIELKTRKYLFNEDPFCFYYVTLYFEDKFLSYRYKISMLDNRVSLIDFITDTHCSVYEANLVNTSSDGEIEYDSDTSSDSDGEIEYDSDSDTSSDSD